MILFPTSKRFRLSCLLILLGFTTQAQLSNNIIDDSNQLEILAEIEYLFQDQIAISSQTLKTFILTPFFNPYDENVPVPDPHTVFADNQKIKFDWPNNNAVSEYSVRWLNLQNGTQGQVSTTDSDHTFYSFDNGKYIFLFQAKQGTVGGGEFIIIEDKPVMLYIDDQCRCRDEEIVVSPKYFVEDEDNNGADMLAWPETYFRRLYRFNIEASLPGSEAESVIYLTIKGNGGQVNRVGFVEYCTTNAGFYGDYVFAQDLGTWSEPYLDNYLSFSFTDGLKFHHLNTSYDGFVTVTECTNYSYDGPQVRSEQAQQIGEEDAFALRAYPNPASHRISLDYRLAIPGNVQVDLVDALGQAYPIFKQAQKAGAHQQRLDLAAFPAGFYTLQIYTQQGREQISLVLTE